MTTALAASVALAGCGRDQGDSANTASAQGSAVANGAALNAPAPPPALPGAAPTTALTASTGEQYAALAAAGDLFETESARIALGKSQRPDVRAFATMMVGDHQRSTADLGRAAAQARPPIRPAPVLSAQQQADLQALRATAGAAFDIVYLRQQVNAHEQAMNLAASYAAAGSVEPLRGHAATATETIRRHLSRARELEVPPPR
ncbi:MAG TPA: DUF4142 domain-containing protein [Allosphingosinicella sp.]